MFIRVLHIHSIKMLSINIKLKKPLKILKTISGFSLDLDSLKFAKKCHKYLSRETVSLNIKKLATIFPVIKRVLDDYSHIR
jgi:hypothetical protein